MSKIGKKIITIPQEVKIHIEHNSITIKGPYGSFTRQVSDLFQLDQKEDTLSVIPKSMSRKTSELWGTTTKNISNIIEGVYKKFTEKLQLTGVGYKAAVKEGMLVLNLGYSHSCKINIPDNIDITIANKMTEITFSSNNKEDLGQFVALIISYRVTERYKGKGIRKVGTKVLLKAGKSAKK